MHTYTVYYVTYETRGIAYESQSFIENLTAARRYSEQLARIGARSIEIKKRTMEAIAR